KIPYAIPGAGWVITQPKYCAKEAERCAKSKGRPIEQLKPDIVAPVCMLFELFEVGLPFRFGVAPSKCCNPYWKIQPNEFRGTTFVGSSPSRRRSELYLSQL